MRADDLSEFEAARARYDRHDYARSADSFRKLVGTEPPRLTNGLLILESRKYYAASLLFQGTPDEARLQFRLLLQQAPDYVIDPLAFPTDVVELFDQVKAGIRRDIDQRRQAELDAQREAERRSQEVEQQRRRNFDRLRSRAEELEVREHHSRWIATLPFGVGQFQNGHRRLGVAFAVTESLAALTSVITYAGHQSIANDRPASSEVDAKNREQRAWFDANLVSFSTFAALALVGIIDAHVRFVPDQVTLTPRPLPLDLDRWVRDQAAKLTAPPSLPGPPAAAAK